MKLRILAVILLAACNKREVSTPVSGSASSLPPIPSLSASAPAPIASPAPASSCKSDLDCDVCSSKTGCGCTLAPSPLCGPMEHPCFAPPCMNRSASCWAGHCVMRYTLAGPCAKDDECEVRDDDCSCDLHAVPKSAPPQKECEGQSCGGRPAKSQFRARCDAAAKRCVLERAPGR